MNLLEAAFGADEQFGEHSVEAGIARTNYFNSLNPNLERRMNDKEYQQEIDDLTLSFAKAMVGLQHQHPKLSDAAITTESAVLLLAKMMHYGIPRDRINTVVDRAERMAGTISERNKNETEH